MVYESLTEGACYIKRKEVLRRQWFVYQKVKKRLEKQTGTLSCFFKATVSVRSMRVHCEMKGPMWYSHTLLAEAAHHTVSSPTQTSLNISSWL